MAHECVVCGQQAPPGALTCPHCGADRPHRQRPVRAQALARRRRLVLGAILAGAVAWALLIAFGGGTSRSRECRAYDTATQKYDQAVAEAVPPEEELAKLRDDVDRFRAACDRSGGG
jgi:hypothetical protein